MTGIDPGHAGMRPWPRDEIFAHGEDPIAVGKCGVHWSGIGVARGDGVVAAKDVPGVAVDKAYRTEPSRGLRQYKYLGVAKNNQNFHRTLL